MSGYIKIDRKILEWEWWSDINTYRLFTYMLLKANWKAGKFKGIDVPRGSFVSSYSKMSSETSLTINEIRTALKHLISTGEITSKTHRKFTVFTVNNYNSYQEDNKEITCNPHDDNKEGTSKSHSINNLLTTIEEKKEEKEGKKENKILCDSDACELFEKVWKLYPVKRGKGQVSLAAKRRLLKVGYEEIVRAMDRYILELEADGGWRKPQNGSTFFNTGYLDYLDANYKNMSAGASMDLIKLESEKQGSDQDIKPEEELIDDAEWWKYGPNGWEE